jgi:hypothetical protein
LGRPLKQRESHTLSALTALHADLLCNAWGELKVGMLLRHGFKLPCTERKSEFDTVLEGWWDRDHPPPSPRALWQFLACDIQRAGGILEDYLVPLTQNQELHAKLEILDAERELRVWKHALGVGPVLPSLTPPPKIFGLRLKLEADGWNIQVEASPESGFADVASDFYSKLRSDLKASDYASLPTPDFVLLGLLLHEHGFRSDAYSKKRLLNAILARPELAGCLIGPTDEPFRLEEGELSQQAIEGKQGRITFILRGPANEMADDAALLTEAPHPIYLWKGLLWKGPTPLPTPTAPRRLLARLDLVKKLQDKGVTFAPQLKVSVRRLTLIPRLELRLESALFGSKEFVVFRLSARAAQAGATLVWGQHGWHWMDGNVPPGEDRDGNLLDYDRDTAEIVAGLLTNLRITCHDASSWCCDLTRNFPETFRAWCLELPPGVELLADSQLEGLIGASWHAELKVRAAAGKGADRDWFDVHIGLQVKDTRLTEKELGLLLKARGKWIRLPGYGFRRLELKGDDDASAAGMLDRIGLSGDETLSEGTATVHRVHALQLASIAEVLNDPDLEAELRGRLDSLDKTPAALPEGLVATLRPYQVEGFQFLAYLSHNGFGGILADDMGLGKTVQALAWLLHLRDLQRAGGNPFRALIVCPKSVTHGWVTETGRFAPSLKALFFTASAAVAGELTEGLIICNYAQLRLNAEYFTAQAWDAVVLDEGQFIKNPGSQSAVTARQLHAPHRMVLTGTPVENRTGDLWSLFAFAQPGLLGSQAGFRRQYPQGDPAALGRLHRRARHFMLRRSKQQVASDLPQRIEDEIIVDLEELQQSLYQAELKQARLQLLKVHSSKELDAVRFNILTSLLRLRQICCHPGLVSPEFLKEPSAKLEALVERLEELAEEGHKVLVFSQFVGMLDIIATRLATENIPCLMLTGQSENRAELIERFQSDKTIPVFLLSIKAAGFGINLTAADYVILYDPWWNPAVEAQAIDRAHRIGQTQVVTAYRLIASGTVEEKIRALQKDKAALARSIVQEESLSSVMDLDSLRQILS